MQTKNPSGFVQVSLASDWNFLRLMVSSIHEGSYAMQVLLRSPLSGTNFDSLSAREGKT